MKYNYAITIANEKFEVEGCASFDEAIKKVEKGIYDRALSDPKFREKKDLYEKPIFVPAHNPIQKIIDEQKPNPNPIQNPDNAGNDDAGKEAKAPESINK